MSKKTRYILRLPTPYSDSVYYPAYLTGTKTEQRCTLLRGFWDRDINKARLFESLSELTYFVARQARVWETMREGDLRWEVVRVEVTTQTEILPLNRL
jgi:hypothetical protein